MVAYLFLVIFRMIDVQKFQKITFNMTKILLGIAILVLMAVFNYKNTLWADLSNVAACVSIVLIFDRKIIKGILGFIKKTIQSINKKC